LIERCAEPIREKHRRKLRSRLTFFINEVSIWWAGAKDIGTN